MSLYRYNRLCFGIASAPAIFQGIIEQILRPIPGVQPYLDDIAVKGLNEQNHLTSLRETFKALRQAGVRLKREKCLFAKPEIKYLGHIFNGAGLSPDPEKVKAILEAPRPQKLEELVSFLGLVQYYGRHIPELSTLAGPLNLLRKNNVVFRWTATEQSSFESLKRELASQRILTHYDDKR